MKTAKSAVEKQISDQISLEMIKKNSPAKVDEESSDEQYSGHVSDNCSPNISPEGSETEQTADENEDNESEDAVSFSFDTFYGFRECAK